MKRHAFRKDANHADIKGTLELLGAGIYDAASDGSPYDFLVFRRGQIFIVEVKDGKKPQSARKLSVKEVRLHDLARQHGVDIHIIKTEDEALALLGARRAA